MDSSIKIITEHAEFKQLESQWKELLKEVPSATFFQSWEWQSTWIDIHRKELFVVLFFDENRLVAIFPFFISRKKFFSQLEYIGSPDSDYLDFIIWQGHEERVLDYFFTTFLSENPALGIVELDSVPETSPNNEFIQKALARHTFRSTILERNCLYIPLPSQWDEFSQSLSGKMRYNLRSRRKKLLKDHSVAFSCLESSSHIDEWVEGFIELHQMRWKSKGRPGAFARDDFKMFHQKVIPLLLQGDMLRLYRMDIDGKPAGFRYLFLHNNRLYDYLGGFDPAYGTYGISLLMLEDIIREAITENIGEFDFIRGEGGYKFKWTDKKRVNRSYFIEKNSLPVFLYSRGKRAVGFVAGIIKEKVPDSVKNSIRAIIPKRLVKILDPYFHE